MSALNQFDIVFTGLLVLPAKQELFYCAFLYIIHTLSNLLKRLLLDLNRIAESLMCKKDAKIDKSSE